MPRARAVSIVFALGALIVAAALVYLQGRMGTTISETDLGVRLEQHDCYAALIRTKDRRGLYLDASCANGRILWSHLAGDKRLTQRVFDGVDRLYLGNLSLLNGVFDPCDLLTRLARDARWSPYIDSEGAAAVLGRVLSATDLDGDFLATLRGAGTSVRSVSVETVLFATDSFPAGCSVVLEKVPGRARVDLMLGEAAVRAP